MKDTNLFTIEGTVKSKQFDNVKYIFYGVRMTWLNVKLDIISIGDLEVSFFPSQDKSRTQRVSIRGNGVFIDAFNINN